MSDNKTPETTGQQTNQSPKSVETKTTSIPSIKELASSQAIDMPKLTLVCGSITPTKFGSFMYEIMNPEVLDAFPQVSCHSNRFGKKCIYTSAFRPNRVNGEFVPFQVECEISDLTDGKRWLNVGFDQFEEEESSEQVDAQCKATAATKLAEKSKREYVAMLQGTPELQRLEAKAAIHLDKGEYVSYKLVKEMIKDLNSEVQTEVLFSDTGV